jgi:acyl-CoA synthetase (AMP-forming)/AMP-acid ligase II
MGIQFKIDDSGFLFYLDRTKQVFKSNGLQVSPEEISNVIKKLEWIYDVAIAGLLHFVINGKRDFIVVMMLRCVHSSRYANAFG